jgi:uncharacterized protein YjiS (DUF1127 family)
MTLFNDTYSVSGARPTTFHTCLLQVSAWLHRLPAGWSARRARNRELQDLYRCSDRELGDMGLSRSDFLAIEKGFYRRD